MTGQADAKIRDIIKNMRLELESNKGECSGALTIETQWDHRKINEIVVGQQNREWRVDDLARAARAQAEKQRREMEHAAQTDPDLRRLLIEAEQGARELEASLEDDPEDKKPWDSSQRQLRAEARAQKAREIFGADLPGGHRKLVDIIRDHSDARVPGNGRAADVPYALPLDDDAILVLAELGKHWLRTNMESLPPLGKRSSEAEDKAFLDSHAEAGSLRELSKVLGELDKAAGRVRTRQLERIRTLVKTKSLTLHR